jgi:hypothetical protein
VDPSPRDRGVRGGHRGHDRGVDRLRLAARTNQHVQVPFQIVERDSVMEFAA